MFLTKKVGDFNKKESESLDFTGLKIPRDYKTHKEERKMFAIIGVLAVIMVIGSVIMLVGYSLFEGALKLVLGIVGVIILIFALRGCMMG